MINIIITKIEDIISNLEIDELINLYSKKLNKNNTKKLYYIIVKNIKKITTKSKLENMLIDSYENNNTNPEITTLLLEIMILNKNE